jgi:hypothetical protein
MGSEVLELWRGVVLNQGTHMLSKDDFLRNMISGLPLLSTKILQEFGIGMHLLDGI